MEHVLSGHSSGTFCIMLSEQTITTPPTYSTCGSYTRLGVCTHFHPHPNCIMTWYHRPHFPEEESETQRS